MTKSNSGLVKSAETERPIHFFRRPEIGVKREHGNPYTYIGQVVLGEPRYEVRIAPDTQGNQRQVFVFALLTLGRSNSEPFENEELRDITLESGKWHPLQTESAQLADLERIGRSAVLEENKLHNRFGEYLTRNGLVAERVAIQIAGMKGSLIPDFVIKEWEFVVEAKPTLSREHVRLAIGQVLDYAFLLGRAGTVLKPAILLPDRPQVDLLALIQSLGISLIVELASGDFEVIESRQ